MVVKIVKKAKKVTVTVVLFFVCYFGFSAVDLHAMENSAAAAAPLPSLQAPVHARTPFRSAVVAGNVPLARELLSTRAADVNEVDAQKRTALHVMLAGSDTPRTQKMVCLLLEYKASVECADNYGIKPIDYAYLQSFALHTILFNWVRKHEQSPDSSQGCLSGPDLVPCESVIF